MSTKLKPIPAGIPGKQLEFEIETLYIKVEEPPAEEKAKVEEPPKLQTNSKAGTFQAFRL